MSQSSQEFKPKKEVEIKFFRLLPPNLSSFSSLSGIYHNIDSVESPESILENKLDVGGAVGNEGFINVIKTKYLSMRK